MPDSRPPGGAVAFLFISFALYSIFTVVLGGISTPFGMMKSGLASGAVVFAYLAYRRAQSGCSWEALGFVRPVPSDVLLGVSTAAASLGSNVLCSRLQLLFPNPQEMNRLSADFTGPASLAVYFVGLAGIVFAEECIFRSYLIPALEARMRTSYAVLLTAGAFGLAHIQWAFPTFVIGLIFGWVFVRRRSIWPLVIAHFLHNVTVTLIGYFLLARDAR